MYSEEGEDNYHDDASMTTNMMMMITALVTYERPQLYCPCDE